MLFNSYIFWTFFAAVIVLYQFLRHRWQNYMLLAASYVFYTWWDWRLAWLIVISTLVSYFAAIQFSRASTSRKRKGIFVVSICISLGMLAVFKYYNFFTAQAVALLDVVGFTATLPMLKIGLPLGISFFTFQTVSYTVDVYRGDTKPVTNLPDFALFVAFFPKLLAGPIDRAHNLMPQILNPRPRREGQFSEGLYLVLIGLFKKIIIVDNMAVLVNGLFAAELGDPEVSGLDYLVGVYAYAFQIYGDFSGYSSIARGVAKWLGFDLMTNFRMPYLAQTPSDFWSRWHISLSTWLRDYLYIPLGGSRGSKLLTYRNLMLTMLLGGLWHGAALTFVAWGLFHGAILCIYRPFERKARLAKEAGNVPRCKAFVSGFIMFNLVCIGWLFFRAESMGQVAGMVWKLFTDPRVTRLTVYGFVMILFYVTPMMAFEYWLERSKDPYRLTKVRWQVRAAVYSYIILMMLVFQPTVHSAFIYFQF